MHADVVVRSQVVHGMARPGCGHHERRARRDAVVHRVEHADVAGMECTEIVATDDDESRVGGVAEPFRE